MILDQGWGSAPDWEARRTTARAVLEEAAQHGRQVLLWPAAKRQVPPVTSPAEALKVLASIEPRPWQPQHAFVAEELGRDARGVAETIWFHDGLARGGTEDLLALVNRLGRLRMIGPDAPLFALTPPRLEKGLLTADLLSTGALGPAQVVAFARAPEGGDRRIALANVESTAEGRATFTFDLPSELQGTVTRIRLADRASAGGAAFADGAIRRVKVGLVAGAEAGPVTTLTSATHYIVKALQPWGDTLRGDLVTAVEGKPAAIVLADYADMPEEERQMLTEWVEGGGLLIRFAGPRLAASIGARGFGSLSVDDPLVPVRLRRGGRVLGGALAWSRPRALGSLWPDQPVPWVGDSGRGGCAHPGPGRAVAGSGRQGLGLAG